MIREETESALVFASLHNTQRTCQMCSYKEASKSDETPTGKKRRKVTT